MIDRSPGSPGRQHIHHRRWFANQEESRPQEMNSFAGLAIFYLIGKSAIGAFKVQRKRN